MQMNRDDKPGTYQIQSYRPGQVTINNQTYTRSLIVSNHTLVTGWPPQSIAELGDKHWDCIINLKPELILIGTGAKLYFPKTEILVPLINQKIGYELMDTAAACRTFTLVSTEARHVIAALLIQ